MEKLREGSEGCLWSRNIVYMYETFKEYKILISKGRDLEQEEKLSRIILSWNLNRHHRFLKTETSDFNLPAA